MKPFFHFLTLFPETIEPWMNSSIVGRALREGLFGYCTYQLRNYAIDKHKSVDDSAYGGGGGMVLRIEPLVAAVESIRASLGDAKVRTIYFSPTGKKLTASLVHETTLVADHFILVCGHYEGVDQRFIEGWVDQEISLGDFVITGGEIPAVAFADCAIRLLEGTLGAENAANTESFSLEGPKGEKLLEYPHYTRPAEFRGKRVPEVLLSGDHVAIARWRALQSLQRTQMRRPDLCESP